MLEELLRELNKRGQAQKAYCRLKFENSTITNPFRNNVSSRGSLNHDLANSTFDSAAN